MKCAIVGTMLALAGCGGGLDLDGDADVPSGYTTATIQAATFAHPQDFIAERPAVEDATRVRYIPRGARASNFPPFVELTLREGKGTDFDAYVRSLEAIMVGVGRARVDQVVVDVPGAQSARAFEISSPAKRGANDRPIESRTLVVDAGADVYLLGAGGPEGDETVDARAVIESFRLRPEG